MINEVYVSYRSRTFWYVEYCIRITVTTFIPTFFERITTAYDRNSFSFFFSFIAIDKQTTAVTQSTCGVHHVAVHFVFKLNIVISQFSRKNSTQRIFIFFALNTNHL